MTFLRQLGHHSKPCGGFAALFPLGALLADKAGSTMKEGGLGIVESPGLAILSAFLLQGSGPSSDTDSPVPLA